MFLLHWRSNMSSISVQLFEMQLDSIIEQHVSLCLTRSRPKIENSVRQILKITHKDNRNTPMKDRFIVLGILQFLDVYDLTRSSMVCRVWNTASQYPFLWRTVILSDPHIPMNAKIEREMNDSTDELSREFFLSQKTKEFATVSRLRHKFIENQYRNIAGVAKTAAGVASLIWLITI